MIARLRLHRDEDVQQTVASLFPDDTTPDQQRRDELETWAQLVLQGKGNPVRGRELFFGKATCGKCHRLFHQGGDLAPDLTAYNRGDVRRMLLSIVDPDAEIREGFENHTLFTDDGRVLNGLKIEENRQVVVLRSIDGQLLQIDRTDIEEISISRRSLMPVGLLRQLSTDEIRDLFAFLTSTTPPL